MPTATATIAKTEATAEAPPLPSRPLGLTDDQRGAIMRLAAPLQPQCRDAFLRILAHKLRGKRDVGDGELHRVARDYGLSRPNAFL
jgi:hypothetical protein